jgi:pimeloyl-ACP methyl ester carboxylesterase
MERIAQGVPGARLEVIAGAGHLPFLEQPETVAPLLTTHLRRNS